jgi:hypothetical protein
MVFESIAELETQHRNAARLFAVCVVLAGLLMGAGYLALTP